MPCPGVGPCAPYNIDLSSCLNVSGAIPDPCLLNGEPVPLAKIDNAKLVASQLLWALTGRQFGLCTAVLRPCRRCESECCLPLSHEFGPGNYPSYPFMTASGDWVNLTCSCQDECSCDKLSEIKLPYPTCSIESVKIDGVVIPSTEYTLYNYYQLVRLGGKEWPTCNDLTKRDTQAGTWSVSLTYGRPVPELVLMGAAEMACEIIKDMAGTTCRLPQRISSVTRQGMSVSFLDSMDFLDKGLTGLYFVDLAIRTYNPKSLAKRASVYSPDMANRWRVES